MSAFSRWGSVCHHVELGVSRFIPSTLAEEYVMNTKSLSISALLSAALFLTLSVSQAGVQTTQALNGATVTTIRVNGLSADMFLIDNATGTNGFLNASRDEIANTSALDFSYVTPEPDPNFVVLIQGAGPIPNSAFTITANTARQVSLLFNHRGCSWGTMSGWRSSAPLLTQGGH
jgi:hypothetical protein